MIQQICDHGDFYEIQPNRARNTICAFGRIGGHVIDFVQTTRLLHQVKSILMLP